MAASTKISDPSTKSHFAYQVIKREILNGDVKPGQRLRLRELSRRLKTSDMPVREALWMLQLEGLVQSENHRGAMVTDLTIERVVEIIATRTYLEVLAVVESVPYHDDLSIKRIEKLIDVMRAARTPARYSEINRQFHAALYAPCPNEFLKSQIDDLWNKVWRTRSRSIFDLNPSRIDKATKEHEAILKALKNRSTAQVEDAARAHRRTTLKGWNSEIDKP